MLVLPGVPYSCTEQPGTVVVVLCRKDTTVLEYCTTFEFRQNRQFYDQRPECSFLIAFGTSHTTFTTGRMNTSYKYRYKCPGSVPPHLVTSSPFFTLLTNRRPSYINTTMSSIFTRGLFKMQDMATHMLFGKEAAIAANHFYELADRTMDGSDVKMDAYRGSVICVVNVASQ